MPPTTKKMYVGSLPKDINDGGNCHKLKIEIMGGDFGSTGTQTYSIRTRGKFQINKEIHGGNVAERYLLKVYENGSNFDFVIETIANYTNIWIQSWVFGDRDGITDMKAVNIVEYNPNNKVEATSLFLTNILFSTNDSYIGIGTETPKSTLDVRGKIIADEVEIKVNRGADFVFDPNYELKPISEIENFIKENRHLPEIPSEKQMIENGISVNEMQIKLLQKIEELTLYVIEQDKRIDNQQKIIKELQNK